jgi:hypothetical protein
LLLAMVLILAGCPGLNSSRLDPCSYMDVPGTATVVEVRDAAPGRYSCPNDPVEIYFDFAPADPQVQPSERISGLPLTHLPLKIGSGMNPPRAWAGEMGLVAGAQVPCVRREIVKGACPAAVYVFPSLDSPAAEKACYPP